MTRFLHQVLVWKRQRSACASKPTVVYCVFGKGREAERHGQAGIHTFLPQERRACDRLPHPGDFWQRFAFVLPGEDGDVLVAAVADEGVLAVEDPGDGWCHFAQRFTAQQVSVLVRHRLEVVQIEKHLADPHRSGRIFRQTVREPVQIPRVLKAGAI